MKKLLFIVLLAISYSISAFAAEISRMEPAFWWVGMKNPNLQIMVYGKNIGKSQVQFDYPGVTLKETAQVENPNYLFLYLEIAPDAQPGTMQFQFKEGKKTIKKSYELKLRDNQPVGIQGFDTSDVLYLIMPDRFANGDASNDNWDGVNVNREDPNARHGGDLKGISEHLDYVSDLGVTAIWLNPVLENKMPGGSYHGYATTDFYKVDQRFGSNEEYCNLINQIHDKGMKVVMDIIYNHCGSSHWWMNDLPCSDWLNHQDGFVQTTHNLYTVVDIHAPKSDVEGTNKGWFVPEMPDMNQQNPHLATYLIQNSIWWIEYSQIDGIRHDTHPYVDFDFLAKWCKAVDDEYPQFNIVGESWYHNSAPLAWWQRNSKVGPQQSNLQTVMDFTLMHTCEEAFKIGLEESSPLRRIYEHIALDFLYEDIDNILVFLDNHDTSRFFKAGETDLSRYKQLVSLLLTTRGIPQLYYGSEILMYGEKPEGDGLLRKDFPGGWAGDAVNAFTKEGRTELQNEAWDYMQKLLQWRKTSKPVTEGKLIHYAPNYDDACYVYARISGDETALVILNGSEAEQTLSAANYQDVLNGYTKGKNVITGEIINLADGIKISSKGTLVFDLIK